jgi:hypothetical protein
MGTCIRKIIFLISAFILILSQSGISLAKDNEYLVGVLGLPSGNWDIMKNAGLNSIILRERETEISKKLLLKKIYVLGVTHNAVRTGIDMNKILNSFERYKKLGDAYGFYLGDDLNCKSVLKIHPVRKLLNLPVESKPFPFVGLISLRRHKGEERSTIDCFKDYNVFTYYYPLMRRSDLSLPKMLEMQTIMNVQLKRYNRKSLVFVQTHQQFWYKKVIKLSKVNKNALLYPDGQAVRMLIYYAIATGANGYFLYNNESLSGEHSQERLLASAQAILETRPLYEILSNAQNVEFFKKENFYGTKVKSGPYDIIFVFNSDEVSYYHPTTKKIQAKLSNIIAISAYKTIYQYSPIKMVPVIDRVDIPQDHALILITSKDKMNTKIFQLNKRDLILYAKILQSRSKKLTENIEKVGVFLSPFKTDARNIKERITALLIYIEKLNEFKREAWIKRSGKLPVDGDKINNLYWKRLLFIPVKGEIFNFYYSAS